METLDWQGWFTLGVILLVLIAMIRGIASPDLTMLAGLISLGAAGVLSPKETFVGFANPAMATVARDVSRVIQTPYAWYEHGGTGI